MVTDAKDFELLGDPSKMTDYSRPPENKLTAVTRVLGVCTAVVMMMIFVVGLGVGWSSPYLVKFTSEDPPFPATADEVSWMASITALGGLPGAFLGPVCIQYFGCKTTMISNGVGLLISWIIVMLANSVSWMYVARFISGACSEIAAMAAPLHLGDISSSGTRGALVTFAMNGMVIGIVVGNTMGIYLSMKLFAGITLIVTLCFILVLAWLPNSPYFLTSRGRTADAEKAISRYNPKVEVHLEMEAIKEFLSISNSMTWLDRFREFNIPRNRKAGLIIIVLTGFVQISGLNPLTVYMESIMIRAMVTAIAPSTVPIIASGIGFIAGWMLVYLVEKFGRKTTWVVSSAGLCVSLSALGTHFYLVDDGFDTTGLQWLPLSSVFLIKIFFNIGIGYVPSILLSEIFAPNVRTIAAFVSTVSSALFSFVSIYGYQYLLSQMAEAYVWWVHAIIMIASLIFGLIFVPKTDGKTLLEIQNRME